MEITVRNALDISGLKSSELAEIEKRCTIRNPEYDLILRFSPSGGKYTKVPKYIKLFNRSGKFITCPRGLNVESLLKLPKDSLLRLIVSDERTGKTEDWPDFLVSPKQAQEEILDAFDRDQSYRRRTGTYLFVSPTGSGKTISSLMVAAKLEQKTLILVHTNLIRDTWIRDIEKSLGIPKKEIGFIQGSKFKIGELITIAMIQTFQKRSDRWKEVWDEVGTVILDECDMVPANTFFRVMVNCTSRNIIGITATPKRKDRLHNVMFLIFGKPLHTVREQTTDTMVPIEKVVEIKTNFRPKRTATQQIMGLPDSPTEVISQVGLSRQRNDLIVENVEKCLKSERRIIVAVSRRNHAHILFKRFAKKFPDASIRILLGGDKNEEIDEEVIAGKCDILVVTQQLVRRGVNYPPMDCLHVAGPIASQTVVQQLVGRVRRKHPGKSGAWVYDYVDHRTPLLSRQFHRERVAVYRKLGVPQYEDIYYAS